MPSAVLPYPGAHPSKQRRALADQVVDCPAQNPRWGNDAGDDRGKFAVDDRTEEDMLFHDPHMPMLLDQIHRDPRDVLEQLGLARI